MANRKNGTRNIQASISHKLLASGRTKMLISILVLGFTGFLDATYLTILSYTRQIPPCTVTHGCERVLTSQFASVGPIPIALFGVGYFITLMVLAILLLQTFQTKLAKLLLTLATAAFIAGLSLIYIQAGILHAFCQYCLLAEALITLIFIFTLILFFRINKPNIQKLETMSKPFSRHSGKCSASRISTGKRS